MPPRQRPAAQLPVLAGAPTEGVLRRPAAAGAVPEAAPGSPRLAAEPTGPYEEGNTRAGRAIRGLEERRDAGAGGYLSRFLMPLQ